jgi:hypothetical protein
MAMGSDGLQHALARARDHQAFQRALLRDPQRTLSGYALTPSAYQAVREHDGAGLVAFGVEPELAAWWAALGPAGAALRAEAERKA